MSSKKEVQCIVTDLDDTIWDWLSMWHGSFEPYFSRIQRDFGVKEEDLISDFRNLHRRYGTTEASFVYRELSSLTENQKEEFDKVVNGQKSILHEYYSNKKNNLKIKEGVREVLSAAKAKGTLIIGFTESYAFYTKYRLKTLGLDGLFDCIYAPMDTGIPESVERHYPEGHWEPQVTEIRYLPKESRKPSPEILAIILKDFRVDVKDAIYIGDKLEKDIRMAKDCGVIAVHATYGDHLNDPRYQLLRKVTHWTDEDVEREKKSKEENKTNPTADYSIKDNFNELEYYFHFKQFPGRLNPEKAKEAIEIWKKVVDVQQHFNDLALRIRNLALTAFTLVVGGIGATIKDNPKFILYCLKIPYGSALAGLGIIILAAFFFMDRLWYHKFLLGAVKQATFIEKRWAAILPELGLSQAISAESPNSFGKRKLRSAQKFYVFYGLLASTLGLLFIILFFIPTAPETEEKQAANEVVTSPQKPTIKQSILPFDTLDSGQK